MSDSASAEILEPWCNPELTGHKAAQARLQQAFASGRLPHAWLISGPRGIGKATLAFRFARYVLSDGGPKDMFGAPAADLYMDSSEGVFRRVAAEGHSDLMTLRRRADDKGKVPATISIDETRKVIGFLRMTSAEGGWRVVVVDAVDEMTHNAANALLKVLEEPPARTVLLLVCHRPGQILATIRSRCCQLPLAPLPEAELVGLLTEKAPNLSEAERLSLARLSEGSIGRALDLLQSGGLALMADLLKVLGDLPTLKIQTLHQLGDRLSKASDDQPFRTGSQLLLWWLARLVRAGACETLPEEIVPGESGLMRRLLDLKAPLQWLEDRDQIAQLFGETERASLDRKQAVINGLLCLQGNYAKTAR